MSFRMPFRMPFRHSICHSVCHSVCHSAIQYAIPYAIPPFHYKLSRVPSVLTQPLRGYLVLPTRLSIVGLLWQILFCPTVHQDSKGGVWSSPTRHPCKPTTSKSPYHQRVLPVPTHTWSLVPHLAEHHILPSGRWLWHKNYQHGQHGPPHWRIEGTLHHCSQHDGFSLLWNSTHLELYTKIRCLPHAPILQQCPHKIPAPQTGHSPTCSLQSSTNSIWHKSSKGGGWHHTTTHSKRYQMHSRHCWYSTVLCVSSWSNISCRTQHNCSTTFQWHTASGGCMSPTPWLRCHSPKCRHLIQSLQHHTFSIHRQLPLFWTWW